MTAPLDLDALSAALAKGSDPFLWEPGFHSIGRNGELKREHAIAAAKRGLEAVGYPQMIAEITALRALENIDAPAFGNLHRVQHGGGCAVKPKLGGSLVQWAADEITALREERGRLREAWQDYFAASEELEILERASDTTSRFDVALDAKGDAIERARALLNPEGAAS